MATLAPIVSWYEGSLDVSSEVTKVIDYGIVDADTISTQKVFYVFNNRDGKTDVPKMTEVSFTTKDMAGGTGEQPPLPLVRDNWIQIKVDSLNETGFTPVGKDNTHGVGTTGSTKVRHLDTAKLWEAGITFQLGDYVKPTNLATEIYKVTQGGETGNIEPTWNTASGAETVDGSVKYSTVKITQTPGTHEILGVANSVSPDGSNAEVNAGGNYAKFTLQAVVPQNATSGRQDFLQRINYKFA